MSVRTTGRNQGRQMSFKPYNNNRMSSRKVHVGNLPFDLQWQELKDHMRQGGTVVRADVITDETGRSKGFGIVEFATIQDAEKAIETLNGSMLMDRPITMRPDRDDMHKSNSAPISRNMAFRNNAPSFNGSGTSFNGNGPSYNGNGQSFNNNGSPFQDNRQLRGNPNFYGESGPAFTGDFMGLGMNYQGNGQPYQGNDPYFGQGQFRNGPSFSSNAPNFHNNVPKFTGNDRNFHESSDSGSLVGRKIYCGNLSFDVQWQDLKDFLKTGGNVLHVDVLTDSNGRSKGSAIAEFATPEDAQRAISTLNETELLGRKIFIREFREESRRPQVGHNNNQPMNIPEPSYFQPPMNQMMNMNGNPYQNNSYQSYQNLQQYPNQMNPYASPQFNDMPAMGPPGNFDNRLTNGRKLYVGNLPFDITWQEVKDHFKAVVPVAHAEVIMGKHHSKGFAIVELVRSEDVPIAINALNNSLVRGRPIHVREDREEM